MIKENIFYEEISEIITRCWIKSNNILTIIWYFRSLRGVNFRIRKNKILFRVGLLGGEQSFDVGSIVDYTILNTIGLFVDIIKE